MLDIPSLNLPMAIGTRHTAESPDLDAQIHQLDGKTLYELKEIDSLNREA